MEITEVKVFPIQEEKLKAFVSIVFDQCFMVNDIKIIQGRDGLFISMPSRKKKNGEFKDVAHPLNNETRRMIEDKVLGEYERILAERGEQLPAPPHHLVDGTGASVAPVAPVSVAAAASVAAATPAAPVAPVVLLVPAAPAAPGAPGAPGAQGAPEVRVVPMPPAAVAPAAGGTDGKGGVQGTLPATAQDAPPEKTLEEIEELHLRDSFWTVT
jgi:stage V sporulation protein G